MTGQAQRVRQIPLALAETAQRTFETFVAGANAAAVAQLLAPTVRATPVYLWGPAGSGKTHLLQAVAERARQAGVQAAWFNAADRAPWLHEEPPALIILDDCDGIDASQQQAAFGLFVEAATHAVPLYAAGRLPPVDLKLREDLRTRLGWGHVHALQPLSEPEVRAALRREADRRGVFLGDEVIDYLLTRFARDLKHLMAQLDRLDEYALASQRAITVPLLKLVLAEEHGA